MSVTHGADVEALRASARELADAAHGLLTISIRLTARVWDVRWNGPDAARFRVAWEEEYAPQLGQVCRALNEAASHITEQAADQERASSATGAASSATDDLRARLGFQRDVLTTLPDAAKLGEVMRVNAAAAAGNLAKLDEVWKMQDAARSAFSQGAGQVLGGLSVLLNAHGLYEGLQSGDYAQVTQNGVPIGVGLLGAAGFIGSGTAAAVTVPFGVGSLIGNEINDAMEGTRYGDQVAQNFDAVFDTLGPAGMLLTPFVLAKSGLDMIGEDGEAPPIP